MIKLVLFDLDDTLYPEQKFVRGGLQAAASLVGKWLSVPADELFKQFWNAFKNGDKYIFNSVLNRFKTFSQAEIDQLVYAYRNHKPCLELFRDAKITLDILKKKNVFVGIITDGYEGVQKNKVESLNLVNLVDLIIYTDSFGREFWKPHTRAFEAALKEFNVPPGEAVYIGDNPQKDFVAPNKLGMHSIQIKRNIGVYQNANAVDGGEPEFKIRSLEEIFTKLSIA